MPSTHANVPRFDMTGGVDSTTRPYLLAQDRWSVHHNMRTINSAIGMSPHKVVLGTLPVSEPVLDLVSLPTGRKNNVLYVAMTDSSILQVRPGAASSSVVLKNDLIKDGSYRRWARYLYNNQIWFTNELNPVSYCDGTTVGHYSTPLPSARYITWFFDHCVVGSDSFQGDIGPTRVRWSHLYNPSQWVPGRGNEADYYDIAEWMRTDVGMWTLTGLAPLGNILYAYTPSCIVPIEYVGLPKVMQVGYPRVFQDVGNSLVWGLAVYKDYHYFFDGNQGEFFRFNGEVVQAIGQPVIRYFLDNINPSFDLAQQTFAVVRAENREVTWYFVSKDSSGAFDRFVTYNWGNEKWYTGGGVAENPQCLGGFGRRARACNELTGTCDQLTGTCDALEDSGESSQSRLWGSAAGKLLRESTTPGEAGSFLVQDKPTLETGDFVYGDLDKVKEIDTIVIHATYTGSTAGIEVSISARSLLDETVSYQVISQKWKPTLPEGRLSFPRMAGRVFRFRFRPVDASVADFTWSAFGENVRAGGAER